MKEKLGNFLLCERTLKGFNDRLHLNSKDVNVFHFPIIVTHHQIIIISQVGVCRKSILKRIKNEKVEGRLMLSQSIFCEKKFWRCVESEVWFFSQIV